MKLETKTPKIERKPLTKEQKEILSDIGFRGLSALEKFVKEYPDWEGTKYFNVVLEELWEEEGYEGPSSEGIGSVSPITEKEADELLEAVRAKEEEPEEGLPLTKEEAPWVFEKEKEKNAIQKVWADIKKLFE
ncbi:MAG: hypothetical protein G01um10143_329 [Parcubacteria group bacterium Gr01-1014_3]|nr:MAG: hypothetical protein G01um10143_329 [Parcubacteria group bacterium Gr01-1014_3]